MSDTIDYRQRLLDLLDRTKTTQARCAAIICEETRRPCSVRTVRSWLNDPKKPSSRACPAWAVEILEKALGTHPTQQLTSMDE